MREPSRPARAQCVLAGQNPYFPYWSSDRLIPRSLDCFEDVHALGKAILGMVYLRMLRILYVPHARGASCAQV